MFDVRPYKFHKMLATLQTAVWYKAKLYTFDTAVTSRIRHEKVSGGVNPQINLATRWR
jgi:hypothetical protein